MAARTAPPDVPIGWALLRRIADDAQRQRDFGTFLGACEIGMAQILLYGSDEPRSLRRGLI